MNLARLPGKIGSAVDFLGEHVKSLNGRVSTKGNQIQVEGLKHKEVKLLLHKFLRHNGLDDHRVLTRDVGRSPNLLSLVRPPSAGRQSRLRILQHRESSPCDSPMAD